MLSFNPGMRVERIELGGQVAAFRHRDGLLEIELPESSATEHGVTISLTASGIPDSRFAYLDSAAEWLRRPPANQLRLLGTEPALFDHGFVALMPGTAWLPIAGPNLDQAGGGADFFIVDLTVAAPRGWLIAGPGRREQIGHEGAVSRVRFRPEVPIAEVGLVAGRFERFATTVADVEVELLLHPDHLRNALFFADAADAVVARIDELLSAADSFGIPYPLGTLSAVEVPSRLRGYRGSWRMQTAMVLPGVLMLKEHGFPTASFEGPLNRDVLSGQDDLGEAMVGRLRVHTGNDVVNGTDMNRGLAHNLFAVTRASGPGADALNFVCEELTYRLLADYNVPVANQFSAHRFDVDAYFGAVFGRAAQGLAAGHFGPLRLFYPYVDRPSTWSLAGATSLADLSHHETPRLAEDALLLRGTSVARAMYDGLGRVRAGQLLAELRRRYAGGTFDADEFALVAASVGADLGEFLGDWLGDSGLPGFLVAPRAQVYRLADDEETGAQRYQARVHVRNDEPVAGLVRFSTDRWGFVTRGWPFRIPAAASVEVGLVLPDAPNQLWLHPYSSLNRGSIRIDLADFDPLEIVDGEVLEGVRPSDWRPERRGLVIDDLDAGFAVIDNDGGVRLRGLGSSLDEWEIDLDQGLPVMERQRGEWIRLQVPSAWGKYRHTAAVVRPGRGDRELAFVASLDRPGRWQVEYHVPNRHVPPPPGAPETYASTLFGALGSMDIHLESGGVEIPVAFDAGAAEVGWNKVGEYDLEDPSVRLLVSNRTDGEAVVADAIRWLRVDGSPAR